MTWRRPSKAETRLLLVRALAFLMPPGHATARAKMMIIYRREAQLLAPASAINAWSRAVVFKDLASGSSNGRRRPPLSPAQHALHRQIGLLRVAPRGVGLAERAQDLIGSARG